MFNYFPHSSAMRTADVVLTLRMAEGPAGYGVYCMLLELLRDSENRKLVNNPKNLAFALNVPDWELVARVISSPDLFLIGDDGTFSSPWLDMVMAEFDQKKLAAQEAGRRGAAKRYGQEATTKLPNSDPIAPPMPTPSQGNSNTPIQSDEKKEIQPPTQPRSKLLALKWRKYDGDFFYDMARGGHPAMTAIDERGVHDFMCACAERGDELHDVATLFELARLLHLPSRMFYFMRELTQDGRKDLRIMTRVREILQDVRGGNFKPKFPADYVLTQLVPLAEP